MSKLFDLSDALCVSKAKVSFLIDCFSQEEISRFQFSAEGLSGFYFVLSELRDEVDAVSDDLMEMHRGEAGR